MLFRNISSFRINSEKASFFQKNTFVIEHVRVEASICILFLLLPTHLFVSFLLLLFSALLLCVFSCLDTRFLSDSSLELTQRSSTCLLVRLGELTLFHI